jgi:hypothetical protein
VDVSRKSKYHGLCGISAKEFVKSCSRDLDELAKKTYDDQTLEMVLQKEFGKDWDGFRFGIDDEVGVVNPNLPEGVMFSPLDVWHVVYSLVRGKKPRSSRWMATMDYEFEFTNFAEMYSGREGFIELAQNLEGGWVGTGLLESKLEREDYMLLSSDLNTKKVFFELGLLSVKSVRADEVLLGSPNWMVTLHAMILLVEKQRHKATPPDLAKTYLSDSENGFGRIVAKAASTATKNLRGTGEDAFHECPFQYFLFLQLFYRFPIVDFTSNRRPTDYKLYKQVCFASSAARKWPTLSYQFGRTRKAPLVEAATVNTDRLAMAVALLYEGGPKVAFIIEVKLATIESLEAESVEDAHKENLAAATAHQAENYVWKGEKVEILQNVVVSGVWHPSTAVNNCYELNASYRFLLPINVSLSRRT